MAARIPTPKHSRPSGYKDVSKNMAKPYQLRRYYTPTEVKIHNQSSDIWVSFFDHVYDLTLLVQCNMSSELVQPLIDAAGTDITHWFDPDT